MIMDTNSEVIFPKFNNLVVQLFSSPVSNSSALVQFIRSTHHNPQVFANLDQASLVKALDTYYRKDSFFSQTFPFIVELADRLHSVFPTTEPDVAKFRTLLRSGESGSIQLTQEMCACILANSFLCTWPRDSSYAIMNSTELPSINYDEMFTEIPNLGAKVAKLHMLFHYFDRIREKMPSGSMIIERKVIQEYPDFSQINQPMKHLRIEEDGVIGTIPGTLEVDFANEFIGGGSISFGCVQEEIKFSICPEMNVSRLYCPKMESNEAIVITGGEQFSKYRGYAFNLSFDGNFEDPHKDDQGNVTTRTVAIDALVIVQYAIQFSKLYIKREIEKAYVGFYEDHDALPTVSTGNWGCGAFGGDKSLKSIIQWVAASAANKDMIHYTFDKNNSLPEDLRHFVARVQKAGKTVADVFNALITLSTKVNRFSNDKIDAFQRILELLGG